MALVLKDIFKNDIQRRINGVISAGQRDNSELDVEFSEYVVTNDVAKSLGDFFEYYNETKPSKNGVWISGFFGSGKSHLLKILSYLLDNSSIDGKSSLSYFEQKLSEDPLLLASIKKGCDIPSESILFNIISANQMDKSGKPESILPIFLRQFYEHQGYYGADFVIAELESELDSENLLDEFTERFESVSGKKWEDAREKKNINRKFITQVFADVTGQSVDDNLLQGYDKSFSLLDFADKVRKYIDSKGKNFRLNFFVDEAGQFVINNSRLMVELQEVATTLSDKCDNRAWVIVTSQDQLDKFIGNFENKINKDDVSKIQGRFYVKLKLTSQNVDEVIQKRLLQKNYEGRQQTSIIYSSKKDSFDALFGFVNGPKHFRSYIDENEFVNTYPFVTYQFDLFKAAFTELSNHGAFPGEYTSTGARSLLDVFHRVLNKIADGQYSTSNAPLVPFDAFYEGIEDKLMDNFKQSIFMAENNIGKENPFAIRVLKAMLLVKYITKDFKSTVHNISTLLLTGFDENPTEVKSKTENALNLLEAQTYIQRKNAEEYDFLTNEEKDIETEIKREIITDDKVYDFLNNIIYKRILSAVSKAKDAYGNTFPVTKQIDDRIWGPKQDLGMVVATSYGGNLESAHLKYAGDELVIILPDEGKLFGDIILSLQTDQYINMHDLDSFTNEKRSVAEQKRTLNNARKENIEGAINKALQKAEMFIKGVECPVKESSNVRGRVEEGLRELVEKVYTNLQMLSGKVYTDATVSAAFSDDLSDMFGQNTEAEKRILYYIDSEKRKGINTTVKSLIDNFSRVPYGWPAQAVLYLVVILFRKGKLDIKQNGVELAQDRLKSLINQTMQWQTLILEAVVEIDAKRIKEVMTFYEDFASKSCPTDNAKGVATALNEAFKERFYALGRYTDIEKYPFIRDLDKEKSLIESSMGKSTSWYFDSFIGNISEELLALEEDISIRFLEFMTNEDQKSKYDEAYDLIRSHINELTEENKSIWKPIKDIIANPNIYRTSDVSKLPGLCSALKQYFSDELLKEKQKSLDSINSYKNSLYKKADYSLLSEGQGQEVDSLIEEWSENLKNAQTKEAVGSVMYYGRSNVDSYIREKSTAHDDIPEEKEKSIHTMKTMQQLSSLSTREDVAVFIEKLKAELETAVDNGYTVRR